MSAPEPGPEREADEPERDTTAASAFVPFKAKKGLTLRWKDKQVGNDGPKAPADRGA